MTTKPFPRGTLLPHPRTVPPGPTAPTAARPLLAPRSVAFWLVALAFSVAMLSTTLPTPLYVIYQQELGFSALIITLLFAVYAAGVLAALVLFGRASDEFGRRRLLLPGLGFAALSAVAFLLAQGLPLLFVGRILSGFSAGIFTGTATATLVDLTGKERAGRATLAATAFNMGGLGVGPLLAGMLAQFAPLPLRLVFWVDLALIALAALAVWTVEETVEVPEHPRLRISRPDLPPEVRAAFIPAATAGFAGFAVLGLFAAVAPSFLSGVLHDTSYALSGAVVFAVFATSTAAQVTLAGRLGSRAMPLGCLGLIVGLGLLAAGLAAESLALVIAAAIVAGLGQGLSFNAGLRGVNSAAPPDHRGAVASSFFIVMYLGLSVPVIGEGIADEGLGMQTAGIAFCGVVAAIAAGALALLIVSRRHATAPVSRDGGGGEAIGRAWSALADGIRDELRLRDPAARVEAGIAPSGMPQLQVQTTLDRGVSARTLEEHYERRAGAMCESCGAEVSATGAGPVVTILCSRCQGRGS